MSQSAGSGSASARTGTFGDLASYKHVAGTAAVTDAQIVLSGFSSDAGPDLHIYLTNGTDRDAVAAGKGARYRRVRQSVSDVFDQRGGYVEIHHRRDPLR